MNRDPRFASRRFRRSDGKVFDFHVLRVVKRITVKTANFALRFAFVFQVKLQQRGVEIAAKQLRFIQRVVFSAVCLIKLRDKVFRRQLSCDRSRRR